MLPPPPPIPTRCIRDAGCPLAETVTMCLAHLRQRDAFALVSEEPEFRIIEAAMASGRRRAIAGAALELGDLLLQDSQPDLAMYFYRHSLLLRPHSRRPLLQIAKILYTRSNSPPADKTLARALFRYLVARYRCEEAATFLAAR